MTLTNGEAAMIIITTIGAYAISVVGAYVIGEMTGRYRERWENPPEPEEDDVARRPLSDEQLKGCLEAKGKTCPRCGHDVLSVDDTRTEEGAVVETVACDECHEQWRLVYTLARVERPE